MNILFQILNGEDDTSNFEEVSKNPRRNNTFDATPSSSVYNPNFSGADLPFVGYGYVHEDELSTFTQFTSDATSRSEVNRLSAQVKSLQKTIDDNSALKQNLTDYQRKNAQMESVEKILKVTKDEMHTLKEKLKEKTAEIANARTQIKTLKNSLKIEEEQRAKNDANISDVLNSTYQKWERAKKLSEQNYEKQISEKNSELLSIQQKLKLCEKELQTKSNECSNLQETIDNFKDRLKSSKSLNNNEKTEFAKKHRESNVHFEGQLRDLRTKLQQQKDAKNKADDEIHNLNEIIQETNENMKLMSDQKEKFEQTNAKLMRELNNEISENHNLRDESQKMMKQMQELQQKIDELSSELRRNRRISTAIESIEGSASVYCSLESLTSEIENQLKKDLVLAKESESEQRLRANNLEETVKRLEAVIERVSKQGISSVEDLLERKNEKLEEKLSTVKEQATVERQASRSAHLALWKLEKQLETVIREKEKLEQALKRCQNEKDDVERKTKENAMTARSREERIKELQSDLTTLKAEIRNERSRWENVEKERNKDKSQIVNLNTKIHKLEIDLDECKSKMRLFEQQKNQLAIENKQLTQKLRNENEELSVTVEKQNELQLNFNTLSNSHEMLKNVCGLMETQLNELEVMYNTQLEQNKDKSKTIDKLWEDIRSRDAKLLQLQQEIRDDKMQKVSADEKLTETSNEIKRLQETLGECHKRMTDLHQDVMIKTESLMKAEELVEVQKEEIQNLQRINKSFDRQLYIMKEENSKWLTELYTSKEKNQKIHGEYEMLHDAYDELKKELDQLNGTLSEMNKYHIQREVKSEATQAQYKKLIDYLQKRVDELSQRKKKTLAEVLFGANTHKESKESNSSKKENLPPPLSTQLQNELKQSFKQRSGQSRAQTTNKISKSNSTKCTPTKKLIETKVPRSASKISAKLSNEMKNAKDNELNQMETHQFEKTSFSNDPDMMAQCIVCKKHFTHDTVYQCKKCKVCVHQYCRGGNTTKCTVGKLNNDDNSSVDTATSSTSNETNTEKPDYNGDIILKENDYDPTIKIHCVYEIDDNILLLGMTFESYLN